MARSLVRRLLTTLVAAIGASAPAGCFDPNLAGATCGANGECPSGLQCDPADNTCKPPEQIGDTPDAAAAIDAPRPDAAVAEKVNQAREIVSGGGRVMGGGYVLDLQVGHWHSQETMQNGGFRLQGATAVKR